MKAICVIPDRSLKVLEIPMPVGPAHGHVLVDMTSATVTHGDKFFLTHPLPRSVGAAAPDDEIYGANGAGRVVAVGPGVPTDYAGRQVAIYKSLAPGTETIGLWCERAHVPYETCLILPETVDAERYSGSFANILTVHAFLDEIVAAGHTGLIVTAGSSATGRIAVSLTRRRNIPAIFLVRSAASRERLLEEGAEAVLDASADSFEHDLAMLAERLGATAVFDGVGGRLLTRIAPALPINATVYVYGFLDGATPTCLPTMLVMSKNLTLRRFSNLESASVRDRDLLAEARREITRMLPDPLFETRIGKAFALEEIQRAMAYEGTDGMRAILVPHP